MREQIIRVLETIYKTLEYPVIIYFSIVAIWVTVHHVREWLADQFQWVGDKDERYRIRTTIVKQMMNQHQTKIAKIRRLRVSKFHKKLSLDSFPKMTDAKEPWANLADYYSVPGRLGTSYDPGNGQKQFDLILGRDEQFRAHKEYSTMMVYTVDEPLDRFLTPPDFVAIQPVGKDCFTYEVHFPKTSLFIRDPTIADSESHEKPKIKVYDGDRDPQHELIYEPYDLPGNFPRRVWTTVTNKFRTRYHVTGGRHDFGDRHAEHDWFRVTIFRPPQKKNIHICWSMQEGVSNTSGVKASGQEET